MVIEHYCCKLTHYIYYSQLHADIFVSLQSYRTTMNNDKTLTVVIPTYNMEKYLRHCLDSLIVSDERMKCIEVLVVNDGSKDSSSVIAHEYESKYPATFRVIDKENGNYGSCVNRGIDEAKGKYFRILDADDRFDNDGFRKFIDALKTAEADMVLTYFYCAHCNYDTGAEEFYYPHPYHLNLKYGETYKADDIDFEETHRAAYYGMHSATYRCDMLRKENVRLQTGISFTDTEYTYYPLAGIKSIMPLDFYLYIYSDGRDDRTVSPSNRVKGRNDWYKVADRMLDDFVNSNRTDKALRKKQTIVLSGALNSYYHTLLCFCQKNDDDNAQAVELYNKIKASAPELLDGLRGAHFRSVLPYFKVWERSGKYMTDFPYSIAAGVLTGVKTLLHGKEK